MIRSLPALKSVGSQNAMPSVHEQLCWNLCRSGGKGCISLALRHFCLEYSGTEQHFVLDRDQQQQNLENDPSETREVAVPMVQCTLRIQLVSFQSRHFSRKGFL